MGLIHLYSATSTTFDHNGTPLVTAREAVVKRDEGFQLTFNIPISQNELHKRVQKEMIVSAMTPDGVNYFRIWDIEKRTTDVKVTALQLLYSLDVKQINPFGGRQYTGNSVLQAFVNSFKSSISPYTFSSSITTSKDFYTNEKDDTSTSHNALAILNKITDNWSGELMLNGFDVRMISKLGTKTDALLYEHKNIASFSDSSSMNGIVTRIYATATYTPERAEGAEEDPEPVVISATVDSPLINQYAVIYEATAEYNDARTEAELRTEILKQYSEFNVDKPERTIDVDTNIVDGTAINFGDELVLKYLVHDVDEVIRCVGYEYDPISENYIGVTLGTLEKTFLTKVTEGISSAVTRQFDKLNKQIQVVQTSANGKNRVTYGPNPVPNAIEGDLWFKHPEGRPDEIELLIYQNGLWLPAPFLTDQDKLAFEQEMSDHYDAALAEIERKDAEYKEIFDDYDETVATMDQEISDAATKAQSALEEAGVSTDLAQTAKDLATTAQSSASAAIVSANQAKTDASTAVTNANQAKEDASTAKTNAQTALDDAQTAITNAGTAATDASQAKEDAQTAITEAGQAVVSANTAKSNAQTALTDAQTALSTANNADTKSGLAEIAANTAKTNAQTALDNSSTAITNAADAITKAGQAETTANTAKTNAQTALDDAQSALAAAGSADSKAGQAIAKANAIPTTITDIIADKNLVNGTYVDTKVNDATGAWSQELVRVEGVIDGLEIGGRNYFSLTHLNSLAPSSWTVRAYLYEFELAPNTEYILSSNLPVGQNSLYFNGGDSDDRMVYENQSLSRVTDSEGKLFIAVPTGRTNTSDILNGTYWVKLEKGNKATDWTPAPEDLYSQEEFKIFNAQYTQDVTGITGRLTTVETDKLDGSTFQTFKQSEYQVTADKVASTITRVDTAEGKITTQGTAISQQATAIASKADKTLVDTLSGTVSNQGTLISQNATDISSKADSELVDDIKGTVDTHTTEISQNATDIASKASSTSVNALTGRVSTAETTISQHATAITSKASQTEVDTVKGTVSSHTTTLGQHATAISSKAESSLVNTIKDTVDTHTTDISQNATDIASKASSTSVNALTGRVSTAESNISQNATAITQRVTTTTYNTGIASKENTVLKQSTAPAHVNGRLWLDTSATPNILKRSTGTAWVKATPTTPGEVGAYSQSAGAGLAGRLTTAETTITQTATAIQSKADQTEVDTVKGTVSGHTTTLSQHATAIASKAESSLVNTIKGTVDTHTTEIGQNATDIASKASSSSVNTLTGRVSTAESNIGQNATAISQRVTTTTYNTGIASKENSVLKQSAAPSHLNGRLWLDTSVTPNILKRSTGTSWVKATPTTASEVGAYSSGQGSVLAGRVTTAETNITQTATAIESKADQTEVDTVKGTVSGHTTTLSQHATAIASKAESSLVNTIKGTVDTHTTEISQNATAIASKASSSSVNTLTGRVNTAESNISQNATAITARLTSSQVNSLVDGKGFATQTWANNQIKATADGIKADMTKVEGKIDGLKIGGRNLLTNSTFKGGNNGWSHQAGNVNYTNGLMVSSGSPTEIYRTNVLNGLDIVTVSVWVKGNGMFQARGGGGARVGYIAFNHSTFKQVSITFDDMGNGNLVLMLDGDNLEVEKVKLEKGNIATDWSPAPEDTMMENDFNVFKASYEATAQGLSSRLTAIDKVGGRLSTAETNISQNAIAISSKANTSTVNTLTGRVSTAETTITQHATSIASKASQSEVNTVKGTVSGHTTTLSQHATAISSKAESSLVNTIKGTVDTHTTNISQNATAISSKASTSSVNTLTGRVSTAESTITQHATSIASKASQTEVDTVKGTVSGHTSTLSQHATQISARLTTAQVNSLVDGKGLAKTTYVDSQITATSNSFGVELTKVEGKIPTEIGGRNLLRNSDIFDTSTWNRNSGTAIGEDEFGQYLYTTNYYPPGNLIRAWGDGADIVLEPNETYVYSIWVWSSVAFNLSSAYNFMHAWVKKDGGNTISGRSDKDSEILQGSVPQNKWTRVVVRLKVLGGIINFTPMIYSGAQAGATIKIRHMQLEKGMILSDWSPSVADLLSQNDFTVFKNSYQTTVDSINTELSKTAKKTDLNGMVTESVLSTKNFVTAGTMTTTLANYAQKNNVPTNTQFNTLKNSYDSMVQTIGTNGNKIAQMVMTDSLFSTSVRNSINADGNNMIKNGNFQNGTEGWYIRADSGNAVRKFRHGKMAMHLYGTPTASFQGATYLTDVILLKQGEQMTVGFDTTRDAPGGDLRLLIHWAMDGSAVQQSQKIFDTNNFKLQSYQRESYTFTVPVDCNTVRVMFYMHETGVEHNVYVTDVSLSRGNVDLGYSPHVEDKANQSQVTQLAGSWALTLKSGNDIKTQINASTSSLRLSSKFIHLNGSSLIDNATIKSAHIDTLNANKITGNTAEFNAIRTGVLVADAVTSTHIKAENALIDTIFGKSALIERLTSKTAFINNIKAISIDVGKITGNTASFISAGFQSLNSQATINGHAIRIQNSSGEFVEMNNTPELRSDDAGGTAVVLGKGRVHFYDSRGHSKGYVGTDMHTAGSYDFGTFLSKGSGIYKFARMADATQTTYAYYTVKSGLTAPASVITNMVQNGYLPDGNSQQFVAKGNMLSQLNGWPNYPNWPTLKAGQQIRYKEVTSQTTGDAYEDIWKFGPSSQGDWRIYFAKHATFEGGTTGTSDRRLKHDIAQTQIEALGHIESLAFKEFKWNRDNKYEPLGLIAQDSGIIRVADDDMEGIDIQRAIMLGLKGIQELQAVVKEQAAKIKQLEEINNQ